MKKNSNIDVLKAAKAVAKKLYDKEIVFKNSVYIDDKNKVQNYNFVLNSDKDVFSDNGTKILTIHKSKGLEADGVLVVAENRKQFFKWLNMTKENMYDGKDEDYRLGYVAYSRAKKVLALTCLEKIEFSELNNQIFEEI